MTRPDLSAWAPWRLRAGLARLRGWKAWSVLWASGAISALSMPPLHLWPALALGLIILFWMVDGDRPGRRPHLSAFLRGFVFGMGYFMAGTFWIAFAFISRGPEFIPLIPLAVPGFAALLAFFWGGAMLAFRLFTYRSPWRVLLFASSLALFEWLRGHVLSGLPWNLPGYAWPAGGEISQSAAWIGIYGLSWVTIFLLVSPAVAASRTGHWRGFLPVAVALVLGASLYGAGAVRLAQASDAVHDDVRLRIVHTAITQAEKWAPQGEYEVRDRYMALSAGPGLDEVTHILWPEGALPYYMLEDARTMRQLGEMMSPDQYLMSGIFGRSVMPDQTEELHNAMAVVDFPADQPRLEAYYVKARLVPFGEVLPLTDLMSAIGFADFARYSFTPGPGPRRLYLEGSPSVVPLICYEAIFPEFLRSVETRPDWVFNLSNDAWFGDNAGPDQHMNQVRYRAIESGLPIARSATRGISGIVDPYGRMPVQAAAGTEGVLDADLPVALPITLYQRLGEGVFFLILVLVYGYMAGRIGGRWRAARARKGAQF